MSDEWDIPDSVIYALGAVAWAAISVEERGIMLAETILSETQGKTPFASFVKRALDKLATLPPSIHVEAATNWLNDAVAVAKRRNAVLHSQHVVQYPGGHDDPAWLSHWPNSGGDPINTPLDADHLLAVARSFDELCDRWLDVYGKLAHEIDPPQGEAPS